MVSIFKVSSDVPRCPPLLEEIEHGRSTAENRTYAPKDIINYYCEEGYRTTSQSWRACALKNIRHTYSAVWLGVTPLCEGNGFFYMKDTKPIGSHIASTFRV